MLKAFEENTTIEVAKVKRDRRREGGRAPTKGKNKMVSLINKLINLEKVKFVVKW